MTQYQGRKASSALLMHANVASQGCRCATLGQRDDVALRHVAYLIEAISLSPPRAILKSFRMLWLFRCPCHPEPHGSP